MNLLGLGFNFGAKDAGLKAKQRSVASGFEEITSEVEKLAKRTEKGAPGLQKMVNPPRDQSGKFTAAVDELVEAVGTDLPRASRRGADRFSRDAEQIEHGEKRIAFGFSFIRDMLDKLGSILRQNRLQTFIQSISLSRLNDIAEKLGDVGGAGGQLTTSFEATIVAAHKSARALGANFGLSGRVLSKFTSQATSMGIALNISTDDAAKSTYAYSLAVDELRAVGIKSATDLAKLSAVTGMQTDQFVDALRAARKQFNFTDEQLALMSGSFIKAGESIGDVNGMFGQMPKILDLVGRRAAVMGKKLSSADLASFASQTAQLTGVFYEMGISQEQAQEMALGVATKMVEAGETFGDLFAGTKQDLDQFHMALGISTGDINNSFQTMKQGPAEFMAGMAQMVLKSKKSGKDIGLAMNMMRGRLSEVFGAEQAAQMVNFFQRADTATLEMMSTAQRGTRDLGRLAREGFSTGRTLAESFDLAKDQFVMSFRAIGRSASVDFVKETKKQFKDFNKSLQAIVKEGGPMATLVLKMSEIHQLGALALIPETLRPMAALFGTATKELTPFLGALGSLGFRINMLASPAALLVSALAGLGMWFASLRMEGKSTEQALGIMGTKLAGIAQKVGTFVRDAVVNLVNYLASVDWDKVISRVLGAVGSLARQAGEFLTSPEFRAMLLRAGEVVGQVGAKLVHLIFDALEGAFDFLNRIDLGAVLDKIGKTALALAAAYMNATVMILEAFVKRLPGLIQKATTLAVKLLVELPAALGRLLSGAAGLIRQFLPKMVEMLLETIWQGLKLIPTLIWKVFKAIPQIIGSLGQLIKGALQLVAAAIIGILTGIENWLAKKFPAAAKVIHVIFAIIKTSVVVTFRVIQAVIGTTIRVLRLLASVIVTVVVAAWNAFTTAIEFAWDNILSPVWEAFKTAIRAIGEVFEWLYDNVIGPVIDTIGDAVGKIADVAGSVYDTVSGVGSSVKGFFGGVKSSILGVFGGGGGASQATNDWFDGYMARLGIAKKETRGLMAIWQDWIEAGKEVVDREAIGKGAVTDLTQNWIDLVATGQRSESEMLRIAGGLSRQFAAANRGVISTTGESIRQSAEQASLALNEAYLAELNFVMHATDLTEQQRRQRLVQIQQDFGALQTQFISLSTATNQQLSVQGEAFQSEAERRFTAFSEALKTRTTTTVAQTSAAVDTFQKELGVSNAEALGFIESIAAINPKEFERDLKIIKKTYIDFAKDVVTKTKDFAASSGQIFNDWTSGLLKMFREVWSSILNLTSIALEAIRTDTARALADVSRIEAALRATYAMRTGIAGADVKQEVRLEIGKTIEENIFQATHHPDWYEKDFKFQVMAMVGALNSILAVLQRAPAGAVAPGSASVGALQKIRKDSRLGYGASRAKTGANLQPS